MNKALKYIAVALISIMVAVGAGYGIWQAWDAGKLGHNPRALHADAMRDAVIRQSFIDAMMVPRKEIPACLEISMRQPAAEVHGLPGIAQRTFPGQHALTFVRQPDPRLQAARDAQFAQLDYLVSKDLLTRSDAIVETEMGPRTAFTYKITWEGFAQLADNSYGNFCFVYGKHEFGDIEKFKPLPGGVANLDVYEVNYKTRVVNVPEWAKTPEAAKLFAQLPELTRPRSVQTKIIRGEKGWTSMQESQTALSEATLPPEARGGDETWIWDQLSIPTPSIEKAQELLAAKANDPLWLSSNGVACLPIYLSRGGDDTETRPQQEPAPYVITFFDKSDRRRHEFEQLATQLNVLAALEMSTLVQMEPLSPPPPPPPTPPAAQARGDSRSRMPPPPIDSHGRLVPSTSRSPFPRPFPSQSTQTFRSGMKYVIDEAGRETLGLTRGNSGCIAIGRIVPEVLNVVDRNVDPQGKSWSIRIHGTFTEVTPMAQQLAARIPALKAAIDNGVPIFGSLSLQPLKSGGSEIRLNSIKIEYPRARYDTVPEYLKPVLPETYKLVMAAAEKKSLVQIEKPLPAGFTIPPEPRHDEGLRRSGPPPTRE